MDIEKIRKLQKQLNSTTQNLQKSTKTFEQLIQDTAEIDAKREQSKLRKTLTKEEKAKEELKVMMEYESKIPEEHKDLPFVELKSKPTEEWDVKIGDVIEYFDPTLSYELTGYRPINETLGLDFNPKLFTVAADSYRENGRYTSLIPGTFKHRNYWLEEFDKCKKGITIGKYRLPGEYYFFLNYYRLPSVLGKKDSDNAQEDNFPSFLVKQYEYFHYLDLARKLGKDALVFKCRGIGYSEIIASNLVHSYTFFRKSRNLVSAFTQEYVDATLTKTWQELDFLNTCTEGGFKRLRMKIDTAMRKRASKLDKDKNETGWMSEIQGIVTDNPRKLRGARTRTIYFEEAGSYPGLVDTYLQAEALVNILGTRVGSRIIGGTGGDVGPQLEGLNKMFYNPEDYSILPYKNTYSESEQVMFTGFFIPSYEMWFGDKDGLGFDSRGVVDTARAKKSYLDAWAKLKDPHTLLKKRAEYCFTPEDAFLLEGSNRFDAEALTELLHNITIHKLIPMPRHIKLHWNLNDEGKANRDKRPKIEFVSDSHIEITELPEEDNNGNVYNGLYVAGIDGIDLDKTTSTGQTDVSEFCMVIMRRQFGLKSPKIVAIYKERPDHIITAFETALKLCSFYNCKALIESTRMSVKQYFEKEHKLNYLLHRPKAATNAWGKTNLKQYGVPATETIIQHQLDLIELYIVDFCDEIQFPSVLNELLKYSYENKRKFDIVAAFGICLLADEDMIGKVVRTTLLSQHKFRVGYVRNEYGQVEFRKLDDDNNDLVTWNGSGYTIHY